MLFHGTEILVFLGATIFGFGILLGLFVWALRGPARTWVVPLVYAVLGVLFTVREIYVENLFGLAVMFAFPWSVLLVFISTSIEKDLGIVWLIPAILVNALLLFLLARFQRGRNVA